MGPKTRELVDLLEEMAELLTAHGERFWAEKLEKSVQWLRNLDGRGISYFLGLFGGMGSINDLSPIAEGQDPIAVEANRKWHRLRL